MHGRHTSGGPQAVATTPAASDQGRTVYEAFLEDPDSLADHGPADDEQLGAAEILESLPDQVVGGSPPWADDPVSVDTDPTGPEIDQRYAVLYRRFPRSAAAYLPPDLRAETTFDEGPREVSRRG